MDSFKKFIRHARAHYRLPAIALVGVLLLAGVLGLSIKAQQEADARKSPETLAIERAPDTWLNHQTSVSEFRQALEGHKLAAVALDRAQPGLVLFTLKNGERASTTVPGCTVIGCSGTVLDKIGDQSTQMGFALVPVHLDPRTTSQRALDDIYQLLSPLAVILTLGVGLFLSIKMQRGMGGGASSGLALRPDTRFSDVIGNAEAKAALARVVAFMQDPTTYVKLKARAPRGVLLVGGPGVGKTLVAKATAGESKANFIHVDGSYFTAMFYGAGVGKVVEIFKLARKKAPCVLFIDEIDGIGSRNRGQSLGGGESELNRIINRILVEMDGFEPLDNVIIVGATNNEENLDEAMRRPGRFDMVVRLAMPTLPERKRLFDFYIQKILHDGSADTAALARMTPGLSPAAIENLVNKAASSAAESRAESVSSEHLLRAIEAQQLGGEVSATKDLLTQETRNRVAVHEAGHAFVGHRTAAGLIERVSIEPRGPALGVTYMTRETEDPIYKKAELVSRLAMMLGGREAELLVFNSVSSGASDDLKRATELACNMVGSLGFSEAFGLINVSGIPKELLGPDTQSLVLKEARVLLEEAQATCRQELTACRSRLDAMAERLMESEVLSGDELVDLLGERTAPRPYLPKSEARAPHLMS